MNYSEVLSDIGELESPYCKPISLEATVCDLWDRQPQDKRIVVRMHSMLPQFKLTSDLLRNLWSFATSPDPRLTGVASASKYSPTHFLSLKVNSAHWLKRGHSLPSADYLIYLAAQSAQAPEYLTVENKFFERMKRSIARRIDREHLIEPLDLCRTCVAFAADEETQRLLLKVVVYFPAVTLQFTPISSLKLVNCPLTMNLTQARKEGYQCGFLTMDQNRRVLPLLPSDSLTYKYALVGIWATGIPESPNTSTKYTPLVHPLVWAICVQFIETRSCREKMSPNPQSNSFLFIHFASKPKFYEVSTQGSASWQTTSFETEIPREEDSYFATCIAQFMREEQSSSSLDLSMGSAPKFINTSYTSPSHYSRTNTPTAYPPRPPRYSNSPSISREPSHVSESYRSRPYSPSSEQIIMEQNKMLAQLQAQVKELQAYVFQQNAMQSTPKLKKNHSQGSFPDLPSMNLMNAKTNTTLRISKELVSTGTNTTFEPKPLQRSQSTDSIPDETPSEVQTTKKFNETEAAKPPRFQPVLPSKLLKGKKQIPQLDIGSFEEDSTKKEYNPLRYSTQESQGSPEPSPHPFNHKMSYKPVEKESSDKTICVPKIEYDSGSDSSGEDEQIEALQRKYLA